MPYVNTYEEIGEQNTLDRLVANTLTSFTDDRVRVIGRGAFYQTNLEELHLPNCMYIDSNALSNSYSLKRLILDINGAALCNINSHFSTTDAVRLVVYVPDELVNAYKSNITQYYYLTTGDTASISVNPWISYDYAARIYGISKIGGTQEWLEQEITDSWETIGAHISAGDAAETYHLGMYKPVDFGSGGIINFQIVGLNQDTISGTNSTAQLTWCAMSCFGSARTMNPVMDGDTLGTGTNGGWPYCSMRTYLANTVLPMFPSNVSTLIKSVDKVSMVRDPSIEGNDKCTDVISSDKLFLFSVREVCLYYSDNPNIEGSGPIYHFAFESTSAKRREGQDSQGNVNYALWWTRSVYHNNQTYWNGISGSGGGFSHDSHYEHGVIFGFCT